MDDAERIPIDIGYEVAGEAAPAGQSASLRESVRDDGTLVVDILVRPCETEPSTDEEIVVCAASPGSGQLQPLSPPATPNPVEVLAEALSAKIGPVEVGSIDQGDGSRTLGLRVRF
jgi:hypothetical protein